MNIPTGNVTFLFTDIEGSTKLAQEFPDELDKMLDVHDKILRENIESNNGYVFKIIGDAFCSAFSNAEEALIASVRIQSSLAKYEWAECKIRVRIGIHSGEAEWNGKEYEGYVTLARVQRIMSSAVGDQILISDDARSQCTSDSVKDPSSKQRIYFSNLGDRRLKDLIQPIRLYQVTADGLRSEFPPLKTLDARPHNLPVQLTSYIGMTNVISDAQELLKKNSLLTLLGPGGSGKTRLAVQIGAELIDHFADGVFLVELDSVTDSTLVLQSIMNSLSLKEEQGVTPEHTLSEHLKDKELLLILDNCEHVIASAAKVAETLLRVHPKLKLIATSRELLNCAGEQKYNVRALTVPDENVEYPADKLLEFESVRMVFERASAIDHGFQITDENAEYITDICRRLDGIPLAIELAASRIRILTPKRISENLSERFRLLSGGRRTSLPRQQTLKALIDWSYELLSDSEKKLWRRLSVFKGGFDFESVKKICDSDGIDEFELIDLLHGLADKSIIHLEENSDRFKLLETIREYGYEELVKTGESGVLLEKHLDFFLALSEIAEQRIVGSEAQHVIELLEREKGNIESALKAGLGIDNDTKGLRLACSMGLFWKIRGRYSEGIRWLNLYQEKFSNAPALLNAKLTLKLGLLLGLQGEFVRGLDLCDASRKIFEDSESNNELTESLSTMAMFSFELGKYEESRRIYERCFELVSESGDKSKIAYLLNDHGSSLMETGQYNEAAEMFEKSISMQTEAGDKRGVAYSLYNLGNVKLEMMDVVKAKNIFEECLPKFRELGDKRGESYALVSLGNSESQFGNIRNSIELIEKSITISKSIGDKRSMSYSLCCLADVYQNSGDSDKALALYEESLAVCREQNIKPLIAYSLMGIGSVRMKLNELNEAKDLFDESLKLSREIGHMPGVAFNLNYLGQLEMLKGNVSGAGEHYRESLRINLDTCQNKEIISNLLGLAELKCSRGQSIDAAKILGYVDNFYDSSTLQTDTKNRERFNSLTAKVREQISEEEYLSAYDEGRNLTLEDVCSIAED